MHKPWNLAPSMISNHLMEATASKAWGQRKLKYYKYYHYLSYQLAFKSDFFHDLLEAVLLPASEGQGHKN